MARKRIRAKDLKKQRWATIVAAVLAIGMIVSLAGVYIGQAVGGNRAALPEQQNEPQPEEYLNFYQDEIEKLESYLDEHGPTEPVLLELVNNYRYLVFIQQLFFNDEEAINESQEGMLVAFQELVKLSPDNSEYRFEIINMYAQTDAEDSLIEGEIGRLLESLHREPNPMVHVSLINLLAYREDGPRVEEEVEWLSGHLEPKVSGGTATGEEKFYYSLLLGEYGDQKEVALDLLEEIIDEEPEENALHQDAVNYRSYLQGPEDSVSTDAE